MTEIQTLNFFGTFEKFVQESKFVDFFEEKIRTILFENPSSFGGIKNGMSLVLVHLLWNTSPWQQRLSFTCTIFSYLRKSLHRSSKIFDEHVQYVGGI